EAPAQSTAFGKLRNWILHLVCLHWHLYLRELRAGTRTNFARTDGAWSRLLRVPAIDCDDTFRGRGGPAIWHAADVLDRARPCRPGVAAVAAAELFPGRHRPHVGWCRDIFRTGSRHRLCRSRGEHRSWIRERHLSRLLLSRRTRRHGRARPDFRPIG